MGAVLSLVGPGVGHGDGRVCMTTGQGWGKEDPCACSQRVGGQKEGARRGRVRGEGKSSLNTGVPREHTSFGSH